MFKKSKINIPPTNIVDRWEIRKAISAATFVNDVNNVSNKEWLLCREWEGMTPEFLDVHRATPGWSQTLAVIK